MQAQCTGGTNIGNLTMAGTFQTTGCMTAGDYFTFNAVAGNTYIFSFCQGGGASSWDTELTLLDNSNSPITYNDFFCNPGNRSEITWVATGTGTFRILATEWPCFSNGTCATLAYREIAPVSAGATCGVPFTVGSLPFVQNNMSTCGAADDYNSTQACASTYMNGEDFVFEYTTTGAECVNLELLNSTGAHGLFVLDGCPDVPSSNCLASVNSSIGTSLSNVALPGAGTYYFIVSSQDPPNSCINFDIVVDNCPTGADCADPRVVGSLPFTAAGETTCGFGDDYDQADACGSTYMNGDDFVMSYTTTGAECIDVFLAGTDNFTGVFVLDGCPDAGGTNCLASNEAPLGQPNVTGVNLPGAGTYYIVVSTSPSPQCTGFDVLVDTCRPPVPCGLNPAPGDSCDIATDITGYPLFCGRTNPAIYNSNISGNLNGQFCGVIDNNHWFKFTADSTTANFAFTVGPCALGLGIQAMVFETPDCINFTGVSNCFNPGNASSGNVIATGLTVGNEYYLMVDGNARDDCEYSVSYNGGPLPVSWGPISGFREAGAIHINWVTFTEADNAGFYIEKGTPATVGEEGSMDWESVGFKEAVGGAGVFSEYTSQLPDITPGSDMFFRIRQVDNNGSVQHSEIISIAGALTETVMINAYPNPVEDILSVSGQIPGGEREARIQLMDLSGRTVMTRNISVGSTGDFAVELDLSQTGPGIYLMAIETKFGKNFKKIAVQ